MSLVGEVFCQPGNIQSVVDLLRASTDCQVSGGVLVLTPYSFSICYDTMHVIVFDSHSHNGRGALVAVVPWQHFVEYFEYFMGTDKNHLGFDLS